MDKQGLINCPNCNKRTFAADNQCIYCKYILNDEHNFNKEIYDFLRKKYNENKNKPETIRIGMNEFNLSIKESQEIVNYIADCEYYNENALQNAEKIKRSDVPRKQLPTNGINYSNYKIYGTRAYKKATFIKIIIPCFIMALILILLNENIISINLGIVSFIFCIILLIKARLRTDVDINPHTFVFSFYNFFIHYILPKLILILSSMLVFTLLFRNILKMEQIFFILCVVLFVCFLIALVKLVRNLGSEFTVDYGNIKYTRYIAGNYQEKHDYTWYEQEIYIINSVKEIKETMNSIIIYGDINKSYYKRSGLSWSNQPNSERVQYLKVLKTFKKNNNLVKSLQIISGQYK